MARGRPKGPPGSSKTARKYVKKRKTTADAGTPSGSNVDDMWQQQGGVEGEGNDSNDGPEWDVHGPNAMKLRKSKYTKVEDTCTHSSNDILAEDDLMKAKFTHRGSLKKVNKYWRKICKWSPVIRHMVEKSGWSRLLSMEISENSSALIHYLVERWWNNTHTFHFHFGELGITPLDWVMLTGLVIGGLPIPYNNNELKPNTFDYVKKNIFPELADPSVLDKEDKPRQWISEGITVSFLRKTYITKKALVASENNVVEETKIAKAFFMYTLGQFFFSNARNYIDAAYLDTFIDFDKIKTYDWGGASLAYLYKSLDGCCRNTKTLNGPFEMLEYWGYEYLGICRPSKLIVGNKDATHWPRCAWWKAQKRTVRIKEARECLAKLRVGDVSWEPWRNCRELLLSDEIKPAVELSEKRVLFSHLDTNVWYLGAAYGNLGYSR